MKKILWLAPLILVIIGGCSFEEPGTPAWQVEMTVPIADRTYSMFEMLADSTLLDSSGNWLSEDGDTLIFNFADSLDQITMEDKIKLDSFEFLVQNYVGVRSVNAPGLQTAIYPLEDLASGISGDTAIVPPFNIDVSEDLDPFPEFDWIQVSYGDVAVTVTNNLPVEIENLAIDIMGLNPYQLVVHTDIPGPMAPDSSVTQVWPLPVGVQIDNDMEVLVHVESPGSSWFVNITGAALTVDVNMAEDIGVTSAFAHIPSQNFDADTAFSLIEEDTVLTAVIKQGYLTFTVTNEMELINNIIFTLPDLTLDGVPFNETFTLEPYQTYEAVEIDLSGYILARPQKDNLIQADVNVNIVDTEDPAYSNPGFVTIDENQWVGTNFHISEMTFIEFTGVMDTLYLDIDQDAIELEGIPEGLVTLGFEYANIDLRLRNAIGLPMTFDITVNAYNKDDILVDSLNLPPLIVEPGDTLNPTLLDTTITGLEQILNIVPDKIGLGGDSYVYGDVVVRDWQWMDIEYVVYTPLALSMPASKLEPEFTTLKDGFDNLLELVELTMNMTSHMPLTGEAMILASFDSLAFDDPAIAYVDTFLHVALPDAPIDPQGYVIETADLVVEQVLTFDQMEMFAGADDENPLYIQTVIQVNSTEGIIARFKPSDYLTVGAAAHVVVNVDLGGN